MCIFAAYDKIYFMTSFLGLADFASLIPVVGILFQPTSIDSDNFINFSIWVGFLYIFRLESIFNFIQLRRSLIYQYNEVIMNSSQQSLNEISYQIGRLIVSITMFVMIASGVVLAVSISNSGFYTAIHSDPLTWFDSVYFVIVTITTLGYGDIVPNTVAAQVVTVLIIITGFGLIPVQVSE